MNPLKRTKKNNQNKTFSKKKNEEIFDRNFNIFYARDESSKLRGDYWRFLCDVCAARVYRRLSVCYVCIFKGGSQTWRATAQHSKIHTEKKPNSLEMEALFFRFWFEIGLNGAKISSIFPLISVWLLLLSAAYLLYLCFWLWNPHRNARRLAQEKIQHKHIHYN